MKEGNEVFVNFWIGFWYRNNDNSILEYILFLNYCYIVYIWKINFEFCYVLKVYLSV